MAIYLDTTDCFAEKDIGNFVKAHLNTGKLMGLQFKRPHEILLDIRPDLPFFSGPSNCTLVAENYPAQVVAHSSFEKPKFNVLLSIPCKLYSKLKGHYLFVVKSQRCNRNLTDAQYVTFIKCGITNVHKSNKAKKRGFLELKVSCGF